MKKHWAIVLPLLAASCAAPQDANHDGIADGVLKPDSVSVVAPATPKGTVSGQLVDTKLQPLADVTVSMTIGSATTDAPVTARSDASGNFMFQNVPAGSQVLLTLTKDGYATLHAYAAVPSAAGNIPINDGNASIGMVALAETRGTVRFTLITPSGRPAANAQAYIQAGPAGVALVGPTGINSSAAAVSAVTGAAQADAQGVVTFGNMPSPADLQRLGNLGAPAPSAMGYGYQVWVDPVDLNSDGIIDSAGTSVFIPASDVSSYGTSRLIDLKQPINSGTGGAAFSLRNSNVASLTKTSSDPLRNLIRTNEPIFLAFTQPVIKSSLVVTVVDEAGVEGGTGTVTGNSTSDTFTVALPSTPAIVEGLHYNLLVRATSAYDGTTISSRGYFIPGDIKSPKTTDPSSFVTVGFRDTTSGNVGKLDNGECVIVTFNQVVIPPDSGIPLEVYFNAELGNAMDRGEYIASSNTEAANGFVLAQLPPPVNIPNCQVDTIPTPYPVDTKSFIYTPRFIFSMVIGSSVTTGIAPGTLVRLAFNKQAMLSGGLNGGTYETAWGVPLTKDVDVLLSKLP